jgi:hypothetical protein
VLSFARNTHLTNFEIALSKHFDNCVWM